MLSPREGDTQCKTGSRRGLTSKDYSLAGQDRQWLIVGLRQEPRLADGCLVRQLCGQACSSGLCQR